MKEDEQIKHTTGLSQKREGAAYVQDVLRMMITK
jgi:hypothetical protein